MADVDLRALPFTEPEWHDLNHALSGVPNRPWGGRYALTQACISLTVIAQAGPVDSEVLQRNAAEVLRKIRAEFPHGDGPEDHRV